MDHHYTYAAVRSGSSTTFHEILSEYSSVIPPKLAELEQQRLETIPATLAHRKEGESKAYLTKEEVATLVDWKLSHGTFRPSLKSLVQQNIPKFIQETTAAGFEAGTLKEALATLTKLRGIGPATASLLLSTNDPDHVPFFSDELFRWVFWEDKPGGKWDRKIKYSVKEYLELAEKVGEVLEERDGVTALDLEKFAYVLGKKGVDLIAGKAKDERDDDEGDHVDHVREDKLAKRRRSETIDGPMATVGGAERGRRQGREKVARTSAVCEDVDPRRSLRSSAKNRRN